MAVKKSRSVVITNQTTDSVSPADLTAGLIADGCADDTCPEQCSHIVLTCDISVYQTQILNHRAVCGSKQAHVVRCRPIDVEVVNRMTEPFEDTGECPDRCETGAAVPSRCVCGIDVSAECVVRC